MKAAVFQGKGVIEVMDRPMPACGPEDVLIEVRLCGVCGTDVHIFHGDEGAADTNPPVILGHEFSGVVAKVGERVQNLKAGDKVCVDPNNMCGSCYYCQKGMAHFCERMIGYGTTADGGFAQYCAVPCKQAYKLADSVSFEEGSMAEPISCCLHGIDMCGLHPGCNVLVIGAGGIGLIMAQLAKISGAATVTVLEPIPEKQALAKKVGADFVFDPTAQDVKAKLRENGIHQIDAAIECVGRRETMLDAIDYAGKNSVAMLFGLGGPDDEIPIKPFSVFKKEVAIKASFINPYTMPRAVSLLNAGALNLKTLIGNTIPLEELGETLADPAKRRSGKILVRP